jgi:bifunctional UDP-N-acetylglucosamine pyrophosphorylase/glucosamine-1-phosphate N-acetyltransferase
MNSSLAAVVLCAGKGTRMKSQLSKVLHPILNKPLCAYPIARALEVGAEKVVAVVGHQGEQVEASLQKLFPERGLLFATQAEQKGTAHAVRCAQEALKGFEGAVLILYGDTPLLRRETLEQLVATWRASGGPLALVTTTPPSPKGYGRVVRENGTVARIVEEKDCTDAQRALTEVNAGVYVADATFLWEALGEIKSANAQGEFYLTDVVELAARRGKVATVAMAFEDTAGVNDKVDLANCTQALRARINEAHMRAGVTFLDPATAYVDEGVQIGADTVIGPMVTLHGHTVIGQNVTIGQGSVVGSSSIADGCEVKPYSVFEEAHVGPRCIIGPFARLRPGSELDEGVHLGNFVETKKTRVGKGSKANHLAYLGDAEIGSGVNVGAGTITCNYDGVNKHKTVLGDGVFIGSDTQLVAPVTVGAGAYVAAGTTVTQDVPGMSLALSRTPQVNKEGWVARKKQGGKGKAHAG